MRIFNKLDPATRVVKHQLFTLLDYSVASSQFTCFNGTLENATTAILERVFYHKNSEGALEAPFVPGPDVWKTKVAVFTNTYRKFAGSITKLTFDEFVNLFSGRKHRVYSNAVENLQRAGFRPRGIGVLSTFIKHEKIKVEKKRLVPRVIQPRKPEYNVLVGRYIRPLEHHLYGIINAMSGHPTVMKGCNCVQIASSILEHWGELGILLQ